MTDYKVTLKNILLVHEGIRNKAYKDSLGHATIGIGFNLDAAGAEARLTAVGADYRMVVSGVGGLTSAQVKELFHQDVQTAINGAKKLVPNYEELSDARKIVLASMCFNLGQTGLGKFKNMIASVVRKDFQMASAEMLDSRWAKQVGGRALYLSNLMLKG